MNPDNANDEDDDDGRRSSDYLSSSSPLAISFLSSSLPWFDHS